MKSTNLILAGILILILVGVAASLRTTNLSSDDTDSTPTPGSTDTPTTTASTPTSPSTASPQATGTATPTTQAQTSSETITITNAGFQPSSLSIKKGTQVCFKNNDSVPHWPASSDHPTHLEYAEFDPKKSVLSGSEWCFTFDKAGSWGYHDHLRPNLTGSITVTAS